MGKLLVDVKKIVFTPYFAIGVMVFVLMCFTSNVTTDYSTGKEYNTFDLLGLSDKELADLQTVAENIRVNGFNGFVSQFLCLYAALPFVRVLCDERKSGAKRYTISRMGIMKYSISKYISAVLSTALVCLIGYLVFSVTVMMIFPSVKEISPELSDSYLYTNEYYLRYLLSVVLVGMNASLCPLLIGTFTNDKYFCICIPVLLQYVHTTIINSLWSNVMTSGYYNKTSEKLLNIFRADAIGDIAWQSNTAMEVGLLYGTLFILVFLVFYFAQRRCVDNGA